MGIGHPLRDIFQNRRVQIGQTDFASVHDVGEVVLEVVLPDCLIDPPDLEEVTGHEFVQTVLRVDLEQLPLDFAVHFCLILARTQILLLAAPEIGFDFDKIDNPLECFHITVHGDFNALFRPNSFDHICKVRNDVAGLDPGPEQKHFLRLLVLFLGRCRF